MRLAYADPPYPGQAKRLYGDHPDYAGEVDHRNLVTNLSGYDGWALSTSAITLQKVLAVCPTNVRIGIWHNTNAAHPGNLGNWWWTWEAVIFLPARPPKKPVRNLISCPPGNIDRSVGNSWLPGHKSRLFCNWIFDLLGCEPEDELDDLFRGTGAVAAAWESWRRQLRLSV